MGTMLAVPMVAFGDPPITMTWEGAPGGSLTLSRVDFTGWMQSLTVFSFDGTPRNYLDPATAENNGNSVLDSAEFALITEICNDTGHPMHDIVHEAFKANVEQLLVDLGGLAENLAPCVKLIMAAYMTLGDGSYGRDDPGPGEHWFEGSVGMAAETIEGMAAYGSGWNGGAPALANYTLLPAIMSACGDADSDDVNNAHEYFGQSMAAADYAAAAADGAVTTCGTGPDPCAGDNYDCVIPGVGYIYDAANSKVYYLTRKMHWEDAEAAAQGFTIAGTPYPSHLATVDDAPENCLLEALRMRAGDDLWLGASDLDVTDAWRWVATGAQFWQGKDDGSPVGGLFSNWNDGEPNGDTEYYCELTSDGTWNDAGERDHQGIIEVVGTFPDEDTNGIPDALESIVCGPYGCSGEGEGEGECEFEGTLNDPVFGEGPLLATVLPSLDETLGDLVAGLGMAAWADWDLEYIEEVIATTREVPGDGVNDETQMALVENIICNEAHHLHDSVLTDFTGNKALFDADVVTLGNIDPAFGALAVAGNLFAAMIGTSQAMADTIDNLILELTEGASGLPSAGSYAMFGAAKTVDEPFSGEGDMDGDGLTNAEEYAAVIAAGGDNGLAMLAIMDPNNLWHGNPALPIGCLAGAALLSSMIALGGAFAIRKKK